VRDWKDVVTARTTREEIETMMPEKRAMLAKLGGRDGHEVIVCSAEEWLPWALTHLFAAHHHFGEVNADRMECVVGRYRGLSGTSVSTVFLGMNTSCETPMWFETMVFGGPLDRTVTRHATWAEAEAGHDEMRKKVAAAEKKSGSTGEVP
jgi:hypothetical protein